MTVGVSNLDPGQPLLHICHAPADDAWVHGRMVHELGLKGGQYRTRADDGLGELQLHEIARAVEACRFTVLIASSAARWDKLAQFAADLAQHAGLAQAHDTPRLIIVARDFALGAAAERARLPLEQRALVGLDCSDEGHTVAALARLRQILALEAPIDERPACPYPGLERFTAANRDLLFGRDGDKRAILQRLRAHHTRILVVGPSGSGKSSLIHAAVLPELAPRDHVVQVVPRGGDLAAALRATVDALEVPRLGAALDRYLRAVPGATDAELASARTQLRATAVPDDRRRVVVIDPLEEIFASDDAGARATLFHLLSGLWSLPWCTVILCMRADFYGAVMVERCWRELEGSQYPVAPLDEAGLVAAIVEPASFAGVHVDAALVERLIREIDRDRSSVPLPLLQVALKELWAHLRWRYLTVADYERIVNHDQRGLGAVLAVHAEAVVQALTGPGDRAVAQRILLDLVHLGEGRPHTRRRRTLDDLRRSGDAPDQLERVLEALVEGRLVTTSDGDQASHGDVRRTHGARVGSRGEPAAEVTNRHIDLTHDTLITGWPALAGWIAERRDDLRIQRRFEARATAGGLLNAAELSELTHWIATPTGVALGASDALRALVQRSASARRFRRGAFGAGVLAVTATAVVFAVQTRQLREEQTKTRKSISKATEAAKLVVFELDDKLKTVACAGAAKVRETSLKSARDLLGELRKLGDLDEDEKRTETFSKTAQADFALERGHLEEAYALYKDVLTDAQRRAAADPSNAGWQRDLAGAYQKLGEVAVTAGKLDDARSWFDKALAVRKTLAATDASNAGWQRDLAVSYERLGEVSVTAGKLDDARAWFEKSLAVRKNFAATDPSNTGSQRDLSISYEKLGEVAVTAGKLDDARAWFEEDLAVAKAIAAASPGNAGWQRDLAVSYHRLGEVAVTAGKLDNARTWFEQALAVAKALAAADPSNTGWQRDLSISYIKLGEVAVTGGKLDDARAWFEQALVVNKTLAAADLSNTGWQRGLSISYAKLGEVAVTAGKLDDARAWFEQDLAVAKSLTAADPSNTGWQRDLSVSYARLGAVAMTAGRLDDAQSWFEQYHAVAKSLAAVDPSNAGWQRDLSVSYNKLGEVAVTVGKLDDAQAWFEKSLAVRNVLAAADPSNADWQRGLSISYEKLGEVAVISRKLDDACTWFEKALAVAETLAAGNPGNAGWQSDLSVSYHELGDVAVTAGKLDDARAWFDKALAIRKPLAAANPSNAGWQSDLSTSYQSLGEVAATAGKLNDARAWLDNALAIRKPLADASSSNADWQSNLAASYHRLGDVAVAAGKLDDARAWFDKALAIRKPLAATSPSNVAWQRDLCTTLARMASVTPNPDEAIQYRRQARVIYDQLQRAGLFRGDHKFAQLGAELDQVAARAGKAPAR